LKIALIFVLASGVRVKNETEEFWNLKLECNRNVMINLKWHSFKTKMNNLG
jgi:hypothetical protein